MRKVPLFKCQECGRLFYTVKAAQAASFGDNGCPGCHGSDIDVYVEPTDHDRLVETVRSSL